MNIRLLYFARLREIFAIGEEAPALPASVSTLADLIAWLRQRGGHWAEELAPGAAG